MRWRDIRFEKPEDGAAVLGMVNAGFIGIRNLGTLQDCIAWMPMSELPKFDRIPDPPEGWRFVEKGEAFDPRCLAWDQTKKHWRDTILAGYSPTAVYIVPIDPPAPQYRPFANAAEFEPHRDRWVRRKEGNFCKVASYEDCGATMGTCATVWKYSELFAEWEFEDGSPFGIKVIPFQP